MRDCCSNQMVLLMLIFGHVQVSWMKREGKCFNLTVKPSLFFMTVESLHVCIQWVVGHQLLLLHQYKPPSHLPVQALPPFTSSGEPLPLPGLTKILRALTFAGHLAHPHQSVEVALCSICDTWKHGSIGHQIKGAELNCLLQLCNRSLQPSAPTERQARAWELKER